MEDPYLEVRTIEEFALGHKVWQLIWRDEKYVYHHIALKIAAEILRRKK